MAKCRDLSHVDQRIGEALPAQKLRYPVGSPALGNAVQGQSLAVVQADFRF